MQNLADAELLEAYAVRGDEAAFGELMRRYGTLVYRACLRMLKDPSEAEDASQAVFVVLAQKAKTLRRGELAAWLYQVAHHVTSKLVRKRMRRNQRETAYGVLEQDSDGQTADVNADQSMLGLVDAELMNLPAHYRQAVILRYLQGRSEIEAASAAGCSLSALSVRASRGIAKLRARLGKLGCDTTASALVGLLTAEASAGIPETLLPSVMSAVHSLLPGAALGAQTGVSAKVITLAKGAMKMMFWNQVKVAALVVAGVAVIGGGGGAVATKLLAEGVPQATQTGDGMTSIDQRSPAVIAMQTNGATEVIRETDVLVLSKTDNGKTVTVRVGQTIRVELDGDKRGTGWELGLPATSLLVRINDPKNIHPAYTAAGLSDFVPAPGQVEPTEIGKYVFLLRPVLAGEEKLTFRYIYPGGPRIIRRAATQLVSEFSVTLRIVAPDAATSGVESIPFLDIGAVLREAKDLQEETAGGGKYIVSFMHSNPTKTLFSMYTDKKEKDDGTSRTVHIDGTQVVCRVWLSDGVRPGSIKATTSVAIRNLVGNSEHSNQIDVIPGKKEQVILDWTGGEASRLSGKKVQESVISQMSDPFKWNGSQPDLQRLGVVFHFEGADLCPMAETVMNVFQNYFKVENIIPAGSQSGGRSSSKKTHDFHHGYEFKCSAAKRAELKKTLETVLEKYRADHPDTFKYGIFPKDSIGADSSSVPLKTNKADQAAEELL